MSKKLGNINGQQQQKKTETKQTDNDLHSVLQKAKDLAKRTPHKIDVT
jgi:hypothetical protein